MRLALVVGLSLVLTVWLGVGEHVGGATTTIESCRASAQPGLCESDVGVLMSRLVLALGPTGRIAVLAFGAAMLGSVLVSFLDPILKGLAQRLGHPDWARARRVWLGLDTAGTIYWNYRTESWVDGGSTPEHAELQEDSLRKESEADIRLFLAAAAVAPLLVIAFRGSGSGWAWAIFVAAIVLVGHASFEASTPLRKTASAYEEALEALEKQVNGLAASIESLDMPTPKVPKVDVGGELQSYDIARAEAAKRLDETKNFWAQLYNIREAYEKTPFIARKILRESNSRLSDCDATLARCPILERKESYDLAGEDEWRVKE